MRERSMRKRRNKFYKVINNRGTAIDLKAEPIFADILKHIIVAGISQYL